MAYNNPRRNIRPQLRARLDAQNQKNNSAAASSSAAGNSVASDIASGNAAASSTKDRMRISLSNRPALSRALPRLSNAGFPPNDGTIAINGDWDQAYDPEKSNTKTWGLLLVIFISLVWIAGYIIGFQASLAILWSVGLLLCVAGLFLPGLGILAIGMVASLDAMANIFLLTGGLLRYNTLNYWLLLVMLAYIPFILRLRDFNSRALQILLLLLTLELSFSSDISRGIQDVLNIGVTFGMVVYFARALKDEISLYWLGIVSGLLSGLGGLIFFLQINSLPYANPNDWTYFQLTGLFAICVSYRYAIKYNKSRLPLLALAAINFAWIFLSASRGSLVIGMLCGAYLFLATRSITWKTMMILIAILIGVWISINFAEQRVYTISRIQLLFDPSVSDTKRTSKRSLIAEAGLRIFEKNPMGIGTGAFAEESTNTNLLATQRPAHSAWIKVLAENGVPGIIFLSIFILSYLIVGIRKRGEGAFLLAAFITVVFASAFVAKEFRGKSLWFLGAAGIAMLHPDEMLIFVQQKLKIASIDYRQQLRKARYGGKK